MPETTPTTDKPESFRALFPPQLKAKRWSVMTTDGIYHIELQSRGSIRLGLMARVQGPKEFQRARVIEAKHMTAETALKALVAIVREAAAEEPPKQPEKTEEAAA